MRIGVVADDLTGALDTGVQFRMWGMSVAVQMVEGASAAARRAEAVVVDTESREDHPEEAYGKAGRREGTANPQSLIDAIRVTVQMAEARSGIF